MIGIQYTICQWATNRFRPSELTKHHPRYLLTFHTLYMSLLFSLCTIPILIVMLLLGHLFHNAPLPSFLTLLLNSSSILVVLLVAWPCALPLLPPLSLTFFLFPVPFLLQGAPAPSVDVLFVALPHMSPFLLLFLFIIDTPYTCALSVRGHLEAS